MLVEKQLKLQVADLNVFVLLMFIFPIQSAFSGRYPAFALQTKWNYNLITREIRCQVSTKILVSG